MTNPLLFLTLVALGGQPIARVAPGDSHDESVQNSWSVHADRVYTSTGEVHENAVVEVKDGKIAAIRPGRSATRDSIRAAALTAGMIDPSVRIHGNNSSVEQSSEVQPHLSVMSSLDVFDERWARQARSGVTTVLANPYDLNVIGGQGVILKTAGPDSLEARRLEGRGLVRGAIGTQPSAFNHSAFGRPTDFYSRRPTTRMGVEWEWRKSFYDADAATRVPEREFPGAETLRKVLRGELGLCIQAWATQDIRTAVFLKEEMQREGLGEIELIIDAAAEAWKEPQLLVRSGAKVILPPFSHSGRTTDNAFMSWNVAKLLHEQGVPIALSSHGARDTASRLAMQAAYARRGGLALDATLEAVTIAPARFLGIDGRVGSVEVGKDADLVLWSGEPFQVTSRVTGVLVDGELVLDPRPEK